MNVLMKQVSTLQKEKQQEEEGGREGRREGGKEDRVGLRRALWTALQEQKMAEGVLTAARARQEAEKVRGREGGREGVLNL